MTENSLFISDLHLSPQRPDMIRLFTRFVDEIAIDADRLYILGDFLEYWLGDDDSGEGLDDVFAALDRLHAAGVDVFLMHGNRDFLIGRKLADRHHFTLIDDPSIEPLNNGNARVLMMHGDLLCTDDVRYQNFRRKIRNPVTQWLLLSLPLSMRRKIASSLRDTSRKETGRKEEFIMDVNQQAVEHTMRDHDVKFLIHGHTHRPGIHHFELDSETMTRAVLGDWYESGSYLQINNGKFELKSFGE